MDHLHERWRQFIRSLPVRGGPEGMFFDLDRRYGDPARHYHGWPHIMACLEELDREPLARDPRALELALWYHDAVYDSRAADNEQRSADLLLDTGCETGLPQDLLSRAAALIRLTRYGLGLTRAEPGQAVPKDRDGLLMRDIDLAILGRPEPDFALYEKNIRLEYAWVPETVYQKKRSRLLAAFLDQPYIYHISSFRERYEDQARKNLSSALKRLQSI